MLIGLLKRMNQNENEKENLHEDSVVDSINKNVGEIKAAEFLDL